MEGTPYLEMLVCLLWHSCLAQYSPIYTPEDARNWNMTVIMSVSVAVVIVLSLLIGCQIRVCNESEKHCTKPVVDNTEAIEQCPILTVKELRGGNGADSEECAVCLVDFQESDSVKMLPKCGHVFHKHCIDIWLPNHMTCPICRRPFTVDDTVFTEEYVKESEVAAEAEAEHETDTVMGQVDHFEVA